MRPDEIDIIRKCIVRISMATRTGLDYLYEMPIEELSQLVKLVTQKK